LYWSACRRSSSSCIRSSLIFFSNFLLIVPKSSQSHRFFFVYSKISMRDQDPTRIKNSIQDPYLFSIIYITTNLVANDSIYNQSGCQWFD
jgi:hypothetical protein